MTTFRATFSGADFFINRLKAINEGLITELQDILEEAGDIIIEYAKTLMDRELGRGKWFYDHDWETGEPASEMFVIEREFIGEDRIRLKIKNLSSHYAYLEFGTSAHTIEASKSPYMLGPMAQAATPEDQFYVKYEVEVSGIPEFEFLQRAIRDTREEVALLIKEAFAEFIAGTGYRTLVPRRARRRARMESRT